MIFQLTLDIVQIDRAFYGNAVFPRGWRQYELTNHLGNVLTTISDKKIGVSSGPVGSLIDYYNPDMVNAQDYYPFGMVSRYLLDGSNKKYRFGFTGKENDNEVKGFGGQQDYGMRIYDNRLGRFLSVDPLTKDYPWYTPYQFAGNTPIQAIDLDGAEPLYNLNDAHKAEREASRIIYGETEGERQYQLSRKGEAVGGLVGIGLGIDLFLFGGIGTKTALTTLTAWEASEIFEYTNRNSNTRDPKQRAENSRNATSATIGLAGGAAMGRL